MQSLFLRGSRGRRRGRRWTWGVESLSLHPQGNTTNAQPMQTSRTVRLRKAQHQNIPNCVRLTTQPSDKAQKKELCANVNSRDKAQYSDASNTPNCATRELSLAHVVKTPVCLHPRRPPRLDGTETSYMMLEFLNNWAIPNIHDMRKLSHVFQRM